MKRNRWMGVGIAIGLGFILLVANVPSYLNDHCLPPEKFSQLRWDMSREQIVALLGPPSSAGTYPDGYSRISYTKFNVWCSLDIYFDSSGKITRMFHDH